VAIMAFILRRSAGTLQIGHVYMVLAVIFAAIGYGAGGNVAKKIGAFRAICWALVLTSPLFVLAAFFVPALPPDLSTPVLLSFLYLAFITQLAGFFAWFAGLAMGGVARVGQVQQLQIFSTLIASGIILDEMLDPELWAFAVFIVVCVAILARLRVDTARRP
jgi:drug/metabolite transporter (DMT)-like permease